MKINLIVLVMLLLLAGAARVNADPVLRANPNPVVLPAGQTRGPTTLTWNTEGAEGFVWVSIDGGEETQLNEAGIAQGTFRTTTEIGKSYVFKLYNADKEQLLASVTVTVVVQQAAPQPPPNAQPGGDRRGRVKRLVNNGSAFRLICRGGPGLGRKVSVPFLANEPGVLGIAFRHFVYPITVDFQRSTQPPDRAGRNLQPGQCSPTEFQLRNFDPTQIRISESVPLKENVQDYLLRDYLNDPNQYRDFSGVVDSGNGYFRADASHSWKPELYKSICDLAREARARNSPAAPGLEAQCRAAGEDFDVNDLAARGEAIANADPLSAALRNQQPEGSSRRGFDIGMAAAEGQTAPGPGKQRIHDSLSPDEQRGFDIAVAFSLERNRNVELAAKGAAIAAADETVAAARIIEPDVFYWLGFDIATGIFGDPALGANGNTSTGPGSLKIRDSLSAAGQRGFNAAVKLHLSRNYKP